MDKPLYNKDFNVNYFERDTNLWQAISYLKYNTHEIRVDLDISVPDMIVKSAEVEFIKYPMNDCQLIKQKIKEVLGLCLYSDFSEKIRRVFLKREERRLFIT